MLAAFAGHMADVNAAASLLPGDPNVERPPQQLDGEAKLQRGKRKRSRFQGQQLQKPPLNRISLLQLADTMAALMLQLGLAILVVATPLLCAGLANSPE